uniref:Uncharacterized protein n=1 Tax=Heliothis virescens TaxID=7102 RepID=A0A2A4JBH8_HELVI
MIVSVKLFIFCVALHAVTTQTLDDSISEPAPVTTEESTPSSPPSTTKSKWQKILPALQTMKSTSKIKKERLLNVAKIIKFLLSDEIENPNNDTTKIFEEIKEIKEPEPETGDIYPNSVIIDYESIVDDRLKSIKEVIEDKSYITDKVTAENKTETVQDTPAPKNKTADFSKILSKISTALAKLKEQKNPTETENSNLSEIPTMMVPIFRPKNGCKNDFNPTLFENSQLGNSASSLTGMNPMPSMSMFNIPCQRASDILEETANYPLPKEFFYDNQAANLRSLAKNTKLNLDNLPFENVVPNSVTCVDSDDSIAVLFKPKTISLMQVYGNLLKKLTVTVLVPYYVSKLAF